MAAASDASPTAAKRAWRGRRTRDDPTHAAKVGTVPLLLIVDEIGYIPLDPQAANLMFTLVSEGTGSISRLVIAKETAHRRSGSPPGLTD